MSESRLHLVPVRSREAKDFVRTWHHSPASMPPACADPVYLHNL